MTIIEIRGPGGQLLERVRSNALTLSVGRAFDNDVILEDEYASAYHLRLTRTEEGWQVTDLESLNGVRLKGSAEVPGLVRSGGELGVGHTTLRIFDLHHPIPDPIPMDGAERRLAQLGRHFVWTGLAATTAAMTTLQLLWQSTEEFKPETALSPVIFSIIVAALIASLWALVSRIIRHRALFRAQLSLWLAFFILNSALDFCAETIGYNASSAELEKALSIGLSFILTATTIWASLTLATHLPPARRMASALGVASIILAMELVSVVRWETQFSRVPNYYSRLQSPTVLWARPSPQSVLLESLPGLFERADADMKERTEE